MDRREPARVVGARYWGPGAFGAALRQAVLEGSVHRLARSVYGPVDGAAGQSGDAGRDGGGDTGTGQRHAG